MALKKMGSDCHAYVGNTLATTSDNAGLQTGVTAAATAGLLTNIKDLKINLQSDKADVSTRGTGRFKANQPTQIDGTISFGYMPDAGDTNVTTLQTAFLSTPAGAVFFAALDGDATVTGSQGLAGNFTVTNFSRNETLNDAVSYDIELSPSLVGWFKKGS